MKQHSLIPPIVGGSIALLCFFFPWIKINMSSMGQESINISGFTFARGMNFVTLAFIAAGAIIGICIYMMNQNIPWKARNLVLICSGVGILCILFMLIRFVQGLNLASRLAEPTQQLAGSDMELDKIFSPQFGGLGTVIGFIVAFIGAWSLPKSDPSMENSE